MGTSAVESKARGAVPIVHVRGRDLDHERAGAILPDLAETVVLVGESRDADLNPLTMQ